MTAQHTPGQPWMWTVEQWREIVDCARKATACRQKARIDREMHRKSAARWLMSDARSAERSARGYERRVVGLLRVWSSPEVRAAIATEAARIAAGRPKCKPGCACAHCLGFADAIAAARGQA